MNAFMSLSPMSDSSVSERLGSMSEEFTKGSAMLRKCRLLSEVAEDGEGEWIR